MITETDIQKMIKRMKGVFVTKKEFQGATDELVRLITGGFNRVDKAIERLNEHADTLDNHEHRLDRLDDKVFSTS